MIALFLGVALALIVAKYVLSAPLALREVSRIKTADQLRAERHVWRDGGAL